MIGGPGTEHKAADDMTGSIEETTTTGTRRPRRASRRTRLSPLAASVHALRHHEPDLGLDQLIERLRHKGFRGITEQVATDAVRECEHRHSFRGRP